MILCAGDLKKPRTLGGEWGQAAGDQCTKPAQIYSPSAPSQSCQELRLSSVLHVIFFCVRILPQISSTSCRACTSKTTLVRGFVLCY